MTNNDSRTFKEKRKGGIEKGECDEKLTCKWNDCVTRVEDANWRNQREVFLERVEHQIESEW
jgi:uncharacterized Fe-S center protein